jgi:transposase-like protein
MAGSVGSRVTRGTVIQSRPNFCPFCDGRQIIKRGVRKNCLRQLQIYWCKDCRKYFSPLAGLRGSKYPPRAIARALCLYNLGHSQEETARRVGREHRVTVPRRTVSNWISSFRPLTTFHRLRSRAIVEFPDSMLKERTLEHQQVYQYKVHLAKLAHSAETVSAHVAAKIESYLLSILEDFPDALFQGREVPILDLEAEPHDELPERATPLRSSKSDFETLPVARLEKENLANDLAAVGLLLARRNKDRHPSVQEFMLANDSSTIACEVPVYLTAEEIAYYKSAGFFVALPELATPITGHIDLVQARHGYIHLLDYKPRARQVDPVNQLVVYALALASRTRLPLKSFKCAWFDEMDYFEFFPLQAVKRKSTPLLAA